MTLRYKLMMFGFSSLCEDIAEVEQRIRQIPVGRVENETLEQCYLIDLESGEKFDIVYDEKGFYIKSLGE